MGHLRGYPGNPKTTALRKVTIFVHSVIQLLSIWALRLPAAVLGTPGDTPFWAPPGVPGTPKTTALRKVNIIVQCMGICYDITL